MTKPIKILLTGFEPYGAYPENVSWAVAEGVTACAVSEAQVVAEQLPVSFRRVGAALRAAVEHHRPDCLVMLGQSPASTNVKLERVALNLMDSAKGDNDGYRPDEEPICAVGPLARSTTLPLKTLCQAVGQRHRGVTISNSCGLYVCNRLYYEALQLAAEMPMEVLFVHLPLFQGQRGVTPREGQFTLAELTETLCTLLEAIRNEKILSL
ncbi:MAG: pyroglutamyl-peptidase I [Alistipes sp.]|nr:pyroglutamyl-peptidase I [Alistipes sp.]MBR0331728.1 pyroglutamyl-peptidase I [Alistipes sp.]